MQDLDLSNPVRQVLHAGPLFRQNDPLKRSVNGWKELWIILLDNYRTSFNFQPNSGPTMGVNQWS